MATSTEARRDPVSGASSDPANAPADGRDVAAKAPVNTLLALPAAALEVGLESEHDEGALRVRLT